MAMRETIIAAIFLKHFPCRPLASRLYLFIILMPMLILSARAAVILSLTLFSPCCLFYRQPRLSRHSRESPQQQSMLYRRPHFSAPIFPRVMRPGPALPFTLPRPCCHGRTGLAATPVLAMRRA